MRDLLQVLDLFLFLALLGALLHLNAPWWVFGIAVLHGVIAYWEGLTSGRNSI